MKRAATVLVIAIVILTLGGCTQVWDFITGFVPEAYDDLVGSWTVISKPADWAGYRFHFNDDRTFEVDYENLYWTDEYTESIILSAHGGDITSVDEAEFTVRITHSLLGDDALGRQAWAYDWIGTEKNTLKMGLFDEETGDPVYYWEVSRD
jgi:hypothetical protein